MLSFGKVTRPEGVNSGGRAVSAEAEQFDAL